MKIFTRLRKIKHARPSISRPFTKLFAVNPIIYSFIVLPCLGIALILRQAYVVSMERYFYQIYIQHENFSDSSCAIPNYHPFDPSIRSFYKKRSPLWCRQSQPYLTYLDYNGNFRINQSAVVEYDYHLRDIVCDYQEIVRNGTDDDVVLYKNKVTVSDGDHVPYDFIKVACRLIFSNKLIYTTVHAQITPLTIELFNKSKILKSQQPSVLIFGIDSLSRLNFIRQLPKTYAFLTNELNSTVLKGLTKVGDNTYPNLMSMLSGYGARYKEGILGPFWGESKAYGYFDDLPIVWQNFSATGYVTMYAEDEPTISVFNYIAKGFKYQPTHFYMRPFYLAMHEMYDGNLFDNRECFANIPRYFYLFNYVEEFVKKMADHAYFGLSFFTGLSHDYLNNVQVVDDKLRNMFRGLYLNSTLENTIVIVFGDHGNRFDAIRSTVIGRIEERMPFFSIHIPDSLNQRHPHLKRNLEANSNVLLSWYDIYELLMDVAQNNLQEISRVIRWRTIGLSPFRLVPRERSCLQAGIATEYCICSHAKELPRNDEGVKVAATVLVDHVNALLRGIPQCAHLSLKRIVGAQLLLPAAHVSNPKGFVASYQVTIEVAPSGAMLEALLQRDVWSVAPRVVGDINRLNRYGNQSVCVHSKELRLYCYCTNT